MPNNSAIPATIILENALCPVCGEGLDGGHIQEHIMFDDCYSFDGQRSPAAAIQTLKALEPAAKVEVLKELAQGLDVAVVPREPTEALLTEAKKWYHDLAYHGMTTDSVTRFYRAMLRAAKEG